MKTTAMVMVCFVVPAALAQLDTVGIYTDLSQNPEMFPYLKACGYNTYEIVDGGFAREPSAQEAYYAGIAQQIDQGQAAGFRVYILLLSNMEQKTGPGEPRFQYGLFPPWDRALMSERLGHIAEAVRRLRKADGFVFFAGDPGGDPSKQSDGNDCIRMGRDMRAIVNREAPGKAFLFDPWAIAAWDQFPSPFTAEFWDKEVFWHKAVVAEPGLLGPDTGIEFPLHNYYRSLALHAYVDAGKEPERYPTPAVVAELRQRGVTRIWGWPYFLIDECDDGYSGHTWGQAQAETRYLHQIVTTGRILGLNGMVGNVSMKGLHAEVLNLYAFGRFCTDPSATPEKVITEFAGFVSAPETRDALAQVLTFIENHSSWQTGMPEKYRLPNLPCTLSSPEQALSSLARIVPANETPFPLPQPAGDYLGLLGNRLRVLAEQAKTVK